MIRIILKLFLRMLKAGEFSLLLSALVIATASISAINLFIERIENTLFSEASTFIAADAKISGSMPISMDWQKQADSLGLKSSKFISFNAMVFSDNGMKLGRAKAVDDHYPLRGTLETLLQDNTRQESLSGPGPGEVWLAPRLISILDVQHGDTVKIGNAELVVAATLISEPDNSSSRFGVAPRALMHIDDVENTGAVQIGSRVNYAFLLAGDSDKINSFKELVIEKLGEHYRWIDPKDGNQALGSAVDRAQRFLLLAGSLSVILSGLAIAIAAQRFANKQRAQVALLKSFGVKPKEIQSIYLSLLASLAILGIILGSALGWALHKVILLLLSNLIPPDLAPSNLNAFTVGALTCGVSLFAFAGPPILALKHIAPLQILKHHTSKLLALRANIAFGLLALTILILYYSRSVLMTIILIIGILLCILVSTIFSMVILSATKKIQQKMSGSIRLGIANLQRSKASTGLQIFVFSSIALLVLILFQVRTNLISNWQPEIENTPNHFIFNIFENDLSDIKDRLNKADIEINEFYPMSRGRLIQVNGQDIDDLIKADSDTNYKRELNLTWSTTLGEDNKIIHGTWWDKHADQNQIQVSSEEEYAEGLGLKLNDELTFSIAGQMVIARLASIRSVEWDSMNPNFYMIFNQSIADSFVANWISSFYLAPNQKSFIDELSRAYPTISLIDFDETLQQIKSVAKRVSMAVEFILCLVLVASLLVVISSIKSSIEERLKESALLRSFGASRRFVQQVVLIEFLTIGLIAGLFACVGAELSLFLIHSQIFEMNYSPNFGTWLIVPVASALIIATIGYLATLNSTHTPPIKILKAHS